MGRKRSKMYEMVDQIRELSAVSEAQADVLRGIGFSARPGNYNTLKRLAGEFSIDLPNGRGGTSRAVAGNTRPLDEILIENSTYAHSSHLKVRLLKEGLL
jgi:hypothetical protein